MRRNSGSFLALLLYENELAKLLKPVHSISKHVISITAMQWSLTVLHNQYATI